MPQLACSIDIATTPENVWSALTNNEFWQQFSGPVQSDWKTGSPVKYLLPDGKLYAEGVVLESQPPRRWSHTWPDPAGERAVEQTQRLTWQIEQTSPTHVRLTMLHEHMTEQAYHAVSGSWPLILGKLKAALESATASGV